MVLHLLGVQLHLAVLKEVETALPWILDLMDLLAVILLHRPGGGRHLIRVGEWGQLRDRHLCLGEIAMPGRRLGLHPRQREKGLRPCLVSQVEEREARRHICVWEGNGNGEQGGDMIVTGAKNIRFWKTEMSSFVSHGFLLFFLFLAECTINVKFGCRDRHSGEMNSAIFNGRSFGT
jgi:hypothetical protein